MASPQVIHLVSNASEHPENTAAKFKVSYNVPFDLKGKKIALIDATFTKSQDNVKEEGIKFEFLRRQKTNISEKINFSPIKQPWDSSIANMQDFFKRFTHTIISKDGTKLVKMTHNYDAPTALLHVTVHNQSATQAKVVWLSHFERR